MHHKISIIIPCYNQAIYLPETIASVLAQTYENWECIIVNDGSTDNTKEVAQSFCQQDSRIIYVEQKNQGLSAARNTGLEKSTGKFIQFLDSDDIIHPTKFEKQIAELKKTTHFCLSICDYYYCDENNTNQRILEKSKIPLYFNLNTPLHDLILNWEESLSIPAHCFLFDSRLFNQPGVNFDTTLANHEDWHCWVSLFYLNPSVFFINEELAVYRKHDTSMTLNRKKMYQGFLTAVNLQKVNFKNEPTITTLLIEKERKIKEQYNREKKYILFMKKKNSKILHYFKRYTPWPIQKILIKIFDL